MQLLFPDDERLCLPVTVGPGDIEVGPRLGGKPPQGVNPSTRVATTRYFVTLPVSADGEVEVSIFLSFDFDQMANAAGRVQGPADELIEVIVHGRSVRKAGTPEHISELSPQRLVIHNESPDWFITGGTKVIDSGHKIGGRPYIEQPRSSMLNELQAAATAGFRQFAQIGFPSGQHDAAVEGDWPFADGVFHLLVRQHETERLEWRWMWDF